jgi:hypothetical protein
LASVVTALALSSRPAKSVKTLPLTPNVASRLPSAAWTTCIPHNVSSEAQITAVVTFHFSIFLIVLSPASPELRQQSLVQRRWCRSRTPVAP